MKILILILIVIIILVWLFILYTALIKKKNTLLEACSSIDVQLKKRYDLIPNILTIANKFMEHERELMNKITELRAQAMRIPADITQTTRTIEFDKQMTTLIEQLQVSAENYPQLKSDQTMLQAMKTYNATEERIAAARRYYNAAAKDLNNAVEIFPGSIVASMLAIKKAEFIKAEEHERQKIDANNMLKN